MEQQNNRSIGRLNCMRMKLIHGGRSSVRNRDILRPEHHNNNSCSFHEAGKHVSVFRNGSTDRHACGDNKTQTKKAKEHVEDIG